MPGRRSLVPALILMLAGCTATGPVAIDPPVDFAGLADVLHDLPGGTPGSTLHVVLVHGMRVDDRDPKAPPYGDLIHALTRRLALTWVKTSAPIPLVKEPPTVTLDGKPVFDAKNWHDFQPTMTVESYRDDKSGKFVVFYRLEYWQALAYLKCRFIVGPDTALEDGGELADYCRRPPRNVASARRLSSKPEWFNHKIKTEIMEWGMSDAVIATSAYGAVLNQAVREAAALPELAMQEAGNHRLAFITESLGSYVVYDALRQTSNSLSSEAASLRRLVCSATQVHMLANQWSLLEFSRLQVTGRSATADGHENAAPPPYAAAGFFDRCPAAATEPAPVSAARRATNTAYGAHVYIAYHEPNDLLTYYTADPEAAMSAEGVTINVVKPYAPVWIPFIVANPVKAHTGQPQVTKLVELVACGHHKVRNTACAPP